MHVCEATIPVRIIEQFVSSLQHCPESYLPLLPNVTELEWGEIPVFLPLPGDSSISLLKYFATPTVTTITLPPIGWMAHSSAEKALLADLPRICPEVTSFTIAIGLGLWPYEEAGEMITQWSKLRTLRTCAIEQSVMSELLSRGTLQSLHIQYYKSSPSYSGRIPETVLELTLSADSPSLCTRFLEGMYASPTRFCLVIGADEGRKETNNELLCLLSRSLDTSRLQSLTFQQGMNPIGGRAMELQQPFLPTLVKFTRLRELDLDLVCTAQMSDADFAYLAESLSQLRSLKLGTAYRSVALPWPLASVWAVVAVLSHCEHLETLHIAFNGLFPPSESSPGEDDEVAPSEETECQGWGVSNRHITELCVGYSPVGRATIDDIASCLKSVMPCLVQIQCKARHEEWKLVEEMLESY